MLENYNGTSVSERQITVTTGQPVSDGDRTGYAITSEMKIDEEN